MHFFLQGEHVSMHAHSEFQTEKQEQTDRGMQELHKFLPSFIIVN
jgi:hypothetical protein